MHAVMRSCDAWHDAVHLHVHLINELSTIKDQRFSTDQINLKSASKS
jgi:hypothetical protein